MIEFGMLLQKTSDAIMWIQNRDPDGLIPATLDIKDRQGHFKDINRYAEVKNENISLTGLR
ncbi:hypothetical protein JSY36_14995 [Bacillus sp. H-16]|uniref:hypothetical protein n=1 Tax=Alteribacter salitolerans TaxID=2912333 RepID=UPI001966892C|nr:hypothetical protein [Alteribacter salitolerans]MBM7097042.1 hypothetical protein [Alteribacter salitolerans]